MPCHRLANGIADLETADFVKLFASMPNIRKIDLRCAGQFKDEVIDYIMWRDIPIEDLRLDAANLISNQKWIEYFSYGGHRLRSIKLVSLDYAMDDEACVQLVRSCPNLQRIKLRKCFKIGDNALKTLAELKSLEHLSLQFNNSTSSDTLVHLISALGPKLRTLSLEDLVDADDKVLAIIRSRCSKLTKLRFCGNDQCTDAGLKNAFLDSANPPLTFVDLSNTRDVNYEAPDGPDEPNGLASAGFEALMEHSGSSLEVLNIRSCRHISQESLSRVFDEKQRYPMLKEIDISFVPAFNTAQVVSMIECCPSLRKISAFACFNVTNIAVPAGLALIGVPDAQLSIVQGDGEIL